MKKVHFRNIRFKVNAGMDIPECRAYARLLDCEASRLETTGDKEQVTCKSCLKRLAAKKY